MLFLTAPRLWGVICAVILLELDKNRKLEKLVSGDSRRFTPGKDV